MPDSVFPADAFRRSDETPDAQFYQQPRFVTHIDEGAIAAVTQLYRDYFPANSALLDLMSSWVSHLPPEVPYQQVVGLGMNEQELRANPRLATYVVQDLNQQPRLPFEDNAFDGAAICVSVDYLTQPVEVLRDLARVLRPDAPVVITFSNRCFPTKAVAAWHALDEQGHLALVKQYLLAAGNWHNIELLDRSPMPRRSDPLYAVIGRAKKP
jgi:SAM-dependent methyltransferase